MSAEIAVVLVVSFLVALVMVVTVVKICIRFHTCPCCHDTDTVDTDSLLDTDTVDDSADTDSHDDQPTDLAEGGTTHAGDNHSFLPQSSERPAPRPGQTRPGQSVGGGDTTPAPPAGRPTHHPATVCSTEAQTQHADPCTSRSNTAGSSGAQCEYRAEAEAVNMYTFSPCAEYTVHSFSAGKPDTVHSCSDDETEQIYTFNACNANNTRPSDAGSNTNKHTLNSDQSENMFLSNSKCGRATHPLTHDSGFQDNFSDSDVEIDNVANASLYTPLNTHCPVTPRPLTLTHSNTGCTTSKSSSSTRGVAGTVSSCHGEAGLVTVHR